MPKTKEEKAAYMRAWYQTPKGKASRAQYLEKTKQRRAEVKRAYDQSPIGRKHSRICDWKRHGIIPENGDYDALYEWFMSTLNCEKCNVLLTEDPRSTPTTRCCDHDHAIKDAPNVRGIICHSCNSRDRCSNTSGHVNIYYDKRSGHWDFKIDRKRLKHHKSGFKTIEEAVAYRDVWMGLNSES